ncbi:MAG: PhzF family phenazine biosynthesis protein [Opitutaceae bacterium]|nr:PhzF family phenazine biosynthesis protein [Opitutaceae bacterium]
MKLPIYVLDAFTSEVFRGNPAAVVVSERALPVDLMQAIAAENNLAETAFVVPQGSIFTIRWFTPTVEIDLCGHATLAAAAALRKFGHTASDVIDFTCASGPLTVTRTGDRLALDFPARPAEPREVTPEVIDALGAVPAELHQAKALMAVFTSEEEIKTLRPRMDLIAKQPGYGFIVTAPGRSADFVSRFFAPQSGIPEDPVTGSSHCTLIPYWAARLGQTTLAARQLSPRGGELWCEARGERVTIAGHCAFYLKGEIVV